MANPITEKRFENCSEMIHDLAGLDLSNDETIDIAMELLELVLLSAELKPDDYIKADLHFDGLTDAEIESYVNNSNKTADDIKKYLTGFIGDETKTVVFLKSAVSRFKDNDGGAVNG